MNNYAAPGGYYPNQYVRSMYFAPQPAAQVVPVINAPSDSQAVRARQSAAAAQARDAAQRQVQVTKAAYEQALQNLANLEVAAPIEEIPTAQQELATVRVPVVQVTQAPVAPVAAPVPAEPVYSSYGFSQGTNNGRLQKQMAESVYYGLPNNMMAAYAPRSTSPAPGRRSRTPSRQPSNSRFGGALSRSSSTATAVERTDADVVRMPKVAQYKMAPVEAPIENSYGRPAAQITSEYHFDTLRGMNAAF